MLRSDSERVLRSCIEETKAEFTEEQIKCLSLALLKVAEQIVEEALSTYKPKGVR